MKVRHRVTGECGAAFIYLGPEIDGVQQGFRVVDLPSGRLAIDPERFAALFVVIGDPDPVAEHPSAAEELAPAPARASWWRRLFS